MSQRSRTGRSSQRSVNPSQHIDSSQVVPSQSNDELVAKCVRLFLIKLGVNVPIKRAYLTQQLFKDKRGKTSEVVLEKASEVLQQVYGLKIRTIDENTNNKKYILVNNLQHPEINKNSVENDLKTTITFLVLTHVFMSKDCATEKSLWDFLKALNIHQEQTLSDTDVHTFVTKQLVKELFLQIESHGAANDNGEIKKKFSWGPRAEDCVSKMEILKFVAKMYGNVNVKTWSTLYEEAEKQFGDEMNGEDEEAMEVESNDEDM